MFGPARVLRYLVGVIPIFLILIAILLFRLWKRSRLVGALVIGLFMFTNLFHVAIHEKLLALFSPTKWYLKTRLRSPLISFLGEIIHPPHGSIRVIVDYLEKNKRPGDLVIATYGNLPIAYYTGLRAIGGLAADNLEEASKADWLITRKILVADADARVMAYLIDYLPWERYEKISFPQIDFPWENNPDPSAHQFRYMDVDPKWNVQIYRKLKPEEPSKIPDPPNLFYFAPTRRIISGTQASRELKQEIAHYLLQSGT